MANVNWTCNHNRLQDTLAKMYVDKDCAHRIADEAIVDLTRLKFSDIAANNWHQIIWEADAQDKLIDLIKRAIVGGYPNEELEKLLEEFIALEAAVGKRVNPGTTVVQEVEMMNPPRWQKEGGYLIDEPPEDWITEEITWDELIVKRFGVDSAEISDFGSNSSQLNVDHGKRNILWVSSQPQLRIEYDPGTSLVNGRKTLCIISDTIPFALLGIIPVERNSTPPTFFRQSFEHTFMTNLIAVLQISNLRSFSISTTKNTNWLRLTAEFDQRIDNVIVDGRPGQSFTTNQTLIGIRGIVRDYILSLSYVSQATSNKVEIENQVALLQSLVDSFKLINPTNLEEEERQSQKAGDQRFQDYVEQHAVEILKPQFRLLMEQWRKLDWEKEESSQRVLQDVKRFKKAMEVFTGNDELLAAVKLSDTLCQLPSSEMKDFFTSLNQSEP